MKRYVLVELTHQYRNILLSQKVEEQEKKQWRLSWQLRICHVFLDFALK